MLDSSNVISPSRLSHSKLTSSSPALSLNTRKSLQLNRRESLKVHIQEKLGFHRRDSLREMFQPGLSSESANSISAVEPRSLKKENTIVIEEFEKEVDIAEKAKNFNFKIDEEEDNSPSVSQPSQTLSAVDTIIQDPTAKGSTRVVIHEEVPTYSPLRNAGQADDDEMTGNFRTQVTKKPTAIQIETPGIAQNTKNTLKREDTEPSSNAGEREVESDNFDVKFRDDDKYASIRWMIFPDDTLKAYWDALISLNLIYTTFIVPYTVSFPTGSENEVSIIDNVSNVIWAIDIVIIFFLAYEDQDDNLVVSRKKIALNYLSGWFILDIVSVFPFDLIFDSRNSHSLVRISKLPRLIRFFRIAKLFRILRFLKGTTKLTIALNDWVRLRPGIGRFFKTIICFFVFCHIASCIWCLQANLNSDDPTNWVFRNDLDGKSNLVLYISSFYFITATIMTVGYGDIHAGNTIERIISVFLMFFGAFLYSFIIGSLSSVILNLDTKHKELEQKLNTLIEIRQKYALDNIMFNKIKRALKYGFSRYEQDNVYFLNELPPQLRTKLSVIMHKDLLKSINFFKDKPDKFLATIGPLLQSVKIGINEYIFTEGEHADEMYFMKSGVVEMVIKEYNNFPFMYIEQGYYFGEVDLLFGETRKHCYRAKTDCELLSLTKKNFTKLFFQDFREVGAEIYNNALKRRVRALKKHKEALERCQTESKDKDKKLNKSKSKTSSLLALNPNYQKEDGSKPTSSQLEPGKEAPLEKKDKLPALDEAASDGVPSIVDINKVSSNPIVEELKQEEARSIELDNQIPRVDVGVGSQEELKLIDLNPRNKMPKRWSFIKQSLGNNLLPLGDNKLMNAGILASPLPKSGKLGDVVPSAISDSQFQFLQQRVDQLEKTLENILEIYQSVNPV